jgi:DNA-binding NarL/FixJ family response regulator
VHTALSFAEARLRIDARRPDLMLADLDLGQEQGREELPRLAAEGRLPRTLVVSGFLDDALERDLRRIPGVRGTLTKPVDLDRLCGRIREELEGDGVGPGTPTVAPGGSDGDGWVEVVPLREGPSAAPSRGLRGAPREDRERP